MRTWIGKVIVAVLVLVLIEFGTRGCVDWGASRSIETNADSVGSVSVASGDVPAAYHYWIMGGLANGSVTLHNINATPMNIARLEVGSSSLEFSRTQLIKGNAQILGKAPYDVTVFLSPANLGDYLNTTVTFQGPYLSAVIDNHPIDAKPELKGRSIVLSDRNHTIRIPLPGRAYLPCQPDRIGVGNGIAVGCSSPVLPKVLSNAAS